MAVRFVNVNQITASANSAAEIELAMKQITELLRERHHSKEQERHKSLSDAVTANRRAVSLATTLYRQGQTDFLNVLNAQRTLFAAEDALVQSDRSLTQSVITLYKALGGGW